MSSFPPLPPPPESGAPPPPPGSLPAGGPEPTAAPEPERRATVPVVVALLLTSLVAAGAFALVTWVGGGDACEDADFESPRFGYCVSTPPGWVALPPEGGDGAEPLDRFIVQDGPGTITVIAVPLSKGQDLARFEQFVRGYIEDAGASAGSTSTLEVDGVDAVAFAVSLEGPDGVVRSREVLFARDGVAWRVTLADEEVGFEASLRQLEELLESWRFM